MKKIAAVLLLAFGLTGCAQLQTAFNVISSSTASISNPVTPDMLNNVENGAIIAFAGLKAYKQSCVQGAIPPSCRATIQKIQVYTRKLPPLLATLRAFVRSNDQVNAVIAYNTVIQLITDFKAVATANSIPTGAN